MHKDMNQKSNALRVETRIDGARANLLSDSFNIHFEVEGREDLNAISQTFALWVCLPIAMALNRPLYILGRVCPKALDNARRLIEIWYIWRPDLYNLIEVDAEYTDSPALPSRNSEIMLYSGGVDSTYALLTDYAATATPVAALTIQGMDYDADDDLRFQALLKKTKPLRDRAIFCNFTVRTNAAVVMKTFGTEGDLGHGFQLFGCLFLFEDMFEAGSIASDSTPEVDMLCTPWGTNMVTNPLFSSDRFHVRTLSETVHRPNKLAALARDPEALRCLSFCTKRKIRPENCGVCSKCSRTKAMLLATTGEIPPIFLENHFDENLLDSMDLRQRGQRASASNIILAAARNGRLDMFPRLVKRLKQATAPQARKSSPWKRLRRLLKTPD
jgi:hypothetical protein